MIEQGWLIVCGVLLLVGLFNLGMIFSVLRARGRSEPFLQGSISDLLNPWKKENDDLDQLHRDVTRLSENQTGDPGERSNG